MSVPIIERVLTTNSVSTTAYIKDTVQLVKSIIIKNDNEAKHYNKYIETRIRGYPLDRQIRNTWRYYHHIFGIYHHLDIPMEIDSLDNGTKIILSRDILNIHKKTRAELLKFQLFYKEVVDAYPDQELLIKAMVTPKMFNTMDEIIALEDFSIVSYNPAFIEENEKDIMYTLQESIHRYKYTRMIPYYSLSDSLFLAAQYTIFYQYLVMELISIRLKNAKTHKAHTYHIKSYLSSHHYLEEHYINLTKKQSLFLYRNLLYLDNHAGSNNTFDILIQKLFTDVGISIVNYIYKQVNELDDQSDIKYKFKQKLLNKDKLIYSKKDYSLNTIKEKEWELAFHNPRELTYNLGTIDFKFKNSLYNLLLSKDLETIILDNTDTVEHKLIPMVIDYWVYLVKTNQVGFLVTVVDPINNVEVKLNTTDLLKLFTIVMYKLAGIELKKFPDWLSVSVFKDPLPKTDWLLKLCYKKQPWYKSLVDEIRHAIPPYEYISTSSQFQEYMMKIYKVNIGLWILKSNLDDKHNNGQFEMMINAMTKFEKFSFDSELPDAFLVRCGLDGLDKFNERSLTTLYSNILNNLFDGKLDFLTRYKTIQKSLVEVFKKFNSYTVQMMKDYYASSPLLVGHKDCRISVMEDSYTRGYHYITHILNIEAKFKYRAYYKIPIHTDYRYKTRYHSKLVIDLSPDIATNTTLKTYVSLPMNNSIILNTGDYVLETKFHNDLHMEFLALNLQS